MSKGLLIGMRIGCSGHLLVMNPDPRRLRREIRFEIGREKLGQAFGIREMTRSILKHRQVKKAKVVG